MGADPILTPEQLAQMVDAGQVRFVMVGDAWRMRRRLGFEGTLSAVNDWVRANGHPVAPDLWRAPGEPPTADAPATRRGFGRGLANTELYDLRPQELVRGEPG